MSRDRNRTGEDGPHSFRGWQRGACLVGVMLMILLALYIMVNAAVGVLTGH